MNYKKTVRKLHDTGCKNSYHTSTDVSMLGYGCGVSQYTQFFVKDLYMYQVLPCPYKGSFDGFPGYKFIKKWVLDLPSQAETFVSKYIETKTTIDDIEKGERSQYWKTLKEKLEKEK